MLVCLLSTLGAVPMLIGNFGGGADGGTQRIEAAASPTTGTVEDDTSAGSLFDSADPTSLLRAGASQAIARPGGIAELDLFTSSPSDDQSANNTEATAPPATEPPATAAVSTTAVSTTEPAAAPPTTEARAPATALPATAALPATTAPPATTPPPATAPPATAPPATAPAATAPPTGTVAAANPGEPTAAQWAVLRQCEAGGNYTIVSGNGKYFGAYQFSQGTWDNTARVAGRTDLVGLKPSQAAPGDQDVLALALWRQTGWSSWPACSKKVAAA